LETCVSVIRFAPVTDTDLPATILRLPMVFGPGDPQHRLFHYVKRMDDHRRHILLDDHDGPWKGSRGYVENVAAAISLAVTDEQPANRIYNVADVDTPTEEGWVRQIGDSIGWNGRVVTVPKKQMFDEMAAAGVDGEHHWVVDTARIREELGYTEPVSCEEALRRTIEWERANPPDAIRPEMFDYETEDDLLTKLRL
jgi:nucleoside-diphosphate-sugar epimerase